MPEPAFPSKRDTPARKASSSPVLRRLLQFLPLALLVVATAAACSTAPQSTFDPKGPVADQQLTLFWLIFWLALAVFIIVEGALLYSIFRFRWKRNQDPSQLPEQVHGNPKLELTWTIIPFFILLAIAIPTYMTIAEHENPPTGAKLVEWAGVDRPHLEVDVIGHQWWWEFRYPELGITTANQMHIPTNTAIVMNLISTDVIHSFWTPKLSGKTDVVPGRDNKMWFIAHEEGIFEGQCAELCGVAHGQMKFIVVAHDVEGYERWTEGQLMPPATAEGEAALRGQTLFATKGCVLCHTYTGQDAYGVQEGRALAFEDGGTVFPGPNITHFATRDTFAGGIADRTDDNLRKWLRNPDELKPGNRMAELAPVYTDRTMRLTDAEIEDLVAYLQSRAPAAS